MRVEFLVEPLDQEVAEKVHDERRLVVFLIFLLLNTEIFGYLRPEQQLADALDGDLAQAFIG